MKKFLIPGVVALSLAAGGALACNKGEKRVQRLTEKLNLTEEQAAQVQEFFSEKRETMHAHREEQRAITLNQLSTVLSEEQLAEFEEMTFRKRHH